MLQILYKFMVRHNKVEGILFEKKKVLVMKSALGKIYLQFFSSDLVYLSFFVLFVECRQCGREGKGVVFTTP